MRIAVVQHTGAGYYSDYISSLLDEAGLLFNYQVKTWSNSIPAFKQHISENAIVYILIESNSSIILKWWYAVKLKSILRKLKPGVVLDLNGINAVTKMKQVIILDQALLYEKADDLNTIHKLARKNLQHTINTSNSIITYSAKKTILNNNNANKIHVIHFTAPANFRKFEWHEKIMIKAMHADNNEYFVSVLNDDAENDFTNLLRGFSAFKKWQQSNMKLLLLPKYEVFEQSIHEKLKKYKHRDDVRLLENLDETALVSVFASAHSLIHFSSGPADLLTLSIALTCTIPVITYKDAEVEEYMNDAAFYTQNRLPETLGSALISLYKDETLQAQLKEAAEKQSVFFKHENFRSALWQLLETAAHS